MYSGPCHEPVFRSTLHHRCAIRTLASVWVPPAETVCDPRLNRTQSLDLAFHLGEPYRHLGSA